MSIIHPTATVSVNTQQDLVRKSIAVTAAMMSAKFSVSNAGVKSAILRRRSQITRPNTDYNAALPTD